MAWRGWDNAEIYDAFVREHRVYRLLNQRLVDAANLASARRVLDLGCGTGATALACLRVLDADAEIVGVDASAEMIEVARANVLDPRARFVVATASSLGEVVSGPFDRVVCNAAFWQFPSAGAVLRALAAVTVSSARVVLNVPAERVRGERPRIHAFQVALARVVEKRTGRPMPATPTGLDLDALDALADEHGFRVEATRRFDYVGSQHELAELMTIPAMIRPLTPELDDDARAEIVQDARSRVDPDERVTVPWLYLVLARR
jgi:SAM-dependent methyltransferase